MAPVYSPEQISEYLSLINIPAEFGLDSDPRPDLAFLTALHIHHITAIPYENLALHYSEKRRVNLDPQFLFEKIVRDGRGRGGYCFENSILFLHVLRALGFDVYPVGVRIRLRGLDGMPQGGYIGWVHVVNIVTMPDLSRWVVDVGFGGDGMTSPIPLTEGATIRNMGTQDARLIKDFLPGQTVLTPGRRVWIYQVRNSEDVPWTSFYGFSDGVEWLPADFEVVNHFTAHSPESLSFQQTRVLVIKFLRRKAEGSLCGEEVYGKRMLVNGTVKENLGGKTKVIKECKSEEERVAVLREFFGLDLTEEQVKAMKGHITEIKTAT